MSTKQTEDSPDGKKPAKHTGISMFISASMTPDVRSSKNEHPVQIPHEPSVRSALRPSQIDHQKNVAMTGIKFQF